MSALDDVGEPHRQVESMNRARAVQRDREERFIQQRGIQRAIERHLSHT